MLKSHSNSKRIRNPAVCISGTVDKVYTLVSCSKGPDDNYKNSFLTIQSKQGLMFGVINIVGTKSRIVFLLKECTNWIKHTSFLIQFQ